MRIFRSKDWHLEQLCYKIDNASTSHSTHIADKLACSTHCHTRIIFTMKRAEHHILIFIYTILYSAKMIDYSTHIPKLSTQLYSAHLLYPTFLLYANYKTATLLSFE